MKVLNKEVKNCKTCKLCRLIDDDNNGTHIVCGYAGITVFNEYNSDSIHKDCPFNKPITIEVIESFGFVNTKQYSDELVFQKNISDYEFYEFSLQEDNRVIIEYWSQEKLVTKVLPKETWGCFNIFAGEINNPIELEFILTSIGVIERK